jgi:hypothetical protein
MPQITRNKLFTNLLETDIHLNYEGILIYNVRSYKQACERKQADANTSLTQDLGNVI